MWRGGGGCGGEGRREGEDVERRRGEEGRVGGGYNGERGMNKEGGYLVYIFHDIRNTYHFHHPRSSYQYQTAVALQCPPAV